MFHNLFALLYNRVIVNIVVKNESTDIYIEVCSKSSVVDKIEKKFKTTSFDRAMQKFITSYTKESPYFYIAVLDYGVEQGAIPTCDKNRLSYFYDRISFTQYKCYEKKWTYFTSKTHLDEIKKQYQEIGVDYIFSPFSLLRHLFEDKIGTNLAMYILVQEKSLSLSIFDNGELLYAEYLTIKLSTQEDEEHLTNSISESDLESDGIDLEDGDTFETIDDLEDFGDIEDLDTLEEIDEFSENKEIEEEPLENSVEAKHETEKHDNLNEDYQRFFLIQKSLGHYYSDAKYESQFIENVYIADGVGVSGDLKRYLEEEMFLNVYIRHTHLAVQLCELSKVELDL